MFWLFETCPGRGKVFVLRWMKLELEITIIKHESMFGIVISNTMSIIA
jgi:hypothetical protein